MSQIVKCEVCGRVYNRRYLNSHKRLSHGHREPSPSSLKSESETVRAIVSMYERLSDEEKKAVRARVAAED